jgi:hypothetical protein
MISYQPTLKGHGMKAVTVLDLTLLATMAIFMLLSILRQIGH